MGCFPNVYTPGDLIKSYIASLAAGLILAGGQPGLPDYGSEHLVMVRPGKTSIELIYDLNGDRDEDIREIRLYKDARVSKPCVVLWDRDNNGTVTENETYVFEKRCREAEGWFKSKGI